MGGGGDGGGGDGGGGDGGGGDGGGQLGATFELPANKKLRPLKPPTTERVAVNDAVLKKRSVNAYLRCSSVIVSGSVGLLAPVPQLEELKTPSTYVTYDGSVKK